MGKEIISFQPEFDAQYNIKYKQIPNTQFYGTENSLTRDIVQYIYSSFASADLKSQSGSDSHITTHMLIPNDYFDKTNVYEILQTVFKDIKNKYNIVPEMPDLLKQTTLFEIAKNIKAQIQNTH